MPEGPEVRVVTDQLSRLIDEYPVLVSFEVIGGRYYNRHPFPNLTTFTDCLEKNPLMIKKRHRVNEVKNDAFVYL